MAPKRKAAAAAAVEDIEDEEPVQEMTQASAAVAVVSAEVAETLANRLCRFVLLREHSRKPYTRTEMKAAVMSEHNDKSGRIFKQVLQVTNEKLRDVAGLELVAEAPDRNAPNEEDESATQAGPSQAGPSQAAATQHAVAPHAGKYGKYGNLFMRSVLPQPVTAEAPMDVGIYMAFVEVCLSLVQQSEGAIDEDAMFEYLNDIGLTREGTLPRPAEQDKIEHLVQKRLVSEAWLRRQKKVNDANTWQYVAGARALINRNVDRADEFRMGIVNS